MSDGSFLHSPKRQTFLIFLLIVTAAVIAAGARTWNAHATKGSAVASAREAAVPATSQGKGRRDHNMQVELMTVRRHGFEPAEITRPRGQFLLAVDNRSGLEEVNLRIIREAGNGVREIKVNRRNPDWRGLVNLPPGSYRMTEADHPDWSCRITITPQ